MTPFEQAVFAARMHLPVSVIEKIGLPPVKEPEPQAAVKTAVDQPAAAIVSTKEQKIFGLPSLEDIQIAPAVGGVISGAGKLGIGLVAGAAGFLGGLLFGGGQEQEQTITQEPDVTVTPEMPVDVGVDPTIKTLLDFITRQQLAAGAGEIGIGAGAVITGDVGTSEITNITNTYPTSINIQKTITETYPTQITVTETVTTAAQEATQERGIDLGLIAVAIAGILILPRILKSLGGKK